MRTIIAGSRDCTNMDVLWEALDTCPWEITTVLCGKARGADTLGEDWANDVGITVEPYPADWDKYGRYQAGRIRNKQMADNAEALIALWNGYSSGTANMINLAKRGGLLVHVHLW